MAKGLGNLPDIRNRDISMSDAVDVQDTDQLSSQSTGLTSETNTTAQEKRPALPMDNLGGWATNK